MNTVLCRLCLQTNRYLYIFTLFFTAVYNKERLILETIYVVNKEILQKKNHLKNEHNFFSQNIYMYYQNLHQNCFLLVTFSSSKSTPRWIFRTFVRIVFLHYAPRGFFRLPDLRLFVHGNQFPAQFGGCGPHRPLEGFFQILVARLQVHSYRREDTFKDPF